MVEGEALVGDSARQYKSRFPTSMRLTKEMRAYALSAAFEPDKVDNMFELFRLFNIAKRSYSLDWTEVWFNWVDRQVVFNTEAYHKARARAYWSAAA
jgi:hypothetical protein